MLTLMMLLGAAAPLFDEAEPLEIVLEGAVSQLVRDDGEQREEWPFRLHLGDRSFEVALRTRGKFRREVCSFPPIRVNFKTKDVQGSVFAGQDKLKLVTHCKSTPAYEMNTLEEYIAYKILNLVTDASFRVRLMHIIYTKEAGAKRSTTKYGFFVEDVDALAARLGAEHIEPKRVTRHDLEIQHATRVALFQFLIGNTDYSVIAPHQGESCCHNAKLIRTETALYSVPYDFDISGMVNPPYALPDRKMNIRTVRQRKYRGFCTDEATLAEALAAFEGLAPKIHELFAATSGMTPRNAKSTLRFLDGFFSSLERSGTTRFTQTCR